MAFIINKKIFFKTLENVEKVFGRLEKMKNVCSKKEGRIKEDQKKDCGVFFVAIDISRKWIVEKE